jgi:hypothetical protein
MKAFHTELVLAVLCYCKLLGNDVAKRGLGPFVEQARFLFKINVQIVLKVSYHRAPHRVKEHAGAKHVNPFKAPSVQAKDHIDQGTSFACSARPNHERAKRNFWKLLVLALLEFVFRGVVRLSLDRR